MKERIKKEIEELESLLKKNSEEVKVEFQQQKSRVTDKIKTFGDQLENASQEQLQSLKDSTTELLDLLDADFDLSYTDFDDSSGKLSSAIEKYESKAKEAVASLSDEASQAKAKISAELHESLNKFKMEMDIQKAHLKGTKDRASSELDYWKEKRLAELRRLKEELEGKKEAAGEKLDQFSDELSTSFDHLKKAFKKLW